MKKNKNVNQQTTVIQLIGDMKQNIEELLRTINCQCGANQHLKIIFGVYCSKIQKLRNQRDQVKSKLDKLYLLQSIPSTQNYTIQKNKQYGSTQLSYKNQNQPIHNQNISIFDIYSPQLLQPFPITTTQKQDTLDYSDNSSYFLTDDINKTNPEDSMLLTQSNIQSHNSSKDEHTKSEIHKLRKKKQRVIVKNFQQFLKQKIQQKHNIIKINQDTKILVNHQLDHHINKTTNTRKPLMDKVVILNH